MGLEALSWSPTVLILPISAALHTFGIGTGWGSAIVFVLAISLPIRTLSFVSLTDRSISRRIFASLVVPLFVSVALIVLRATQMLATMIGLYLDSSASIAGVVLF